MSEASKGKKAVPKGREVALGSEDESNHDEEDEGLLSGDVGSQPSATTRQIRRRQSRRGQDSVGNGIASGNLQDANLVNTDPAYEFKLVTLYEHSRLRGHKACAYRGCHEDVTLAGESSAFTQSGVPRKFYKWLHKKAERDARKEAARVVQAELVLEAASNANAGTAL